MEGHGIGGGWEINLKERYSVLCPSRSTTLRERERERERNLFSAVVTGTRYGTKTPPDQQPTWDDRRAMCIIGHCGETVKVVWNARGGRIGNRGVGWPRRKGPRSQ